MITTNQNFQEIMDQWDEFYTETFPLIKEFCVANAIYPKASIVLLEKAFLKLSFEYPNMVKEEYIYILERLFDIILEIQDNMSDEQNVHNNALILLSQYYQSN